MDGLWAILYDTYDSEEGSGEPKPADKPKYSLNFEPGRQIVRHSRSCFDDARLAHELEMGYRTEVCNCLYPSEPVA